MSRRSRAAGAIDTSTPEGAALLAWMHPTLTSERSATVAQHSRLTTAMHALGHELSPECQACAAPAQVEPVVGAYAEIEQPSNVVGSTERVRAVVLITSANQREGYVYVGWTNAQPGGRWDRNQGQWGYFRQYPEPREHGTHIVRILPIRAVASPTGWRDYDAPAGAGEEVEAYRG